MPTTTVAAAPRTPSPSPSSSSSSSSSSSPSPSAVAGSARRVPVLWLALLATPVAAANNATVLILDD
ncbi:MFS transporter, partial [Streptomyces sp. AA8]|nr:MFS transporter [Streptomyces telluris]